MNENFNRKERHRCYKFKHSSIKKRISKKNVKQKFTKRVKQKFEKKIRKIKSDKNKFRKIKVLDFKIIKKFKKIAIYQKLSITSIETNFMFINTTNVKNQKNDSVFDLTFKLNKLTKMNFVMKSKLKRSTMNINKSNSKVILWKKNVINFEKRNRIMK